MSALASTARLVMDKLNEVGTTTPLEAARLAYREFSVLADWQLQPLKAGDVTILFLVNVYGMDRDLAARAVLDA